MKKAWLMGVALLGASLLTAPAQASLTMTITDDGGGVTVIGETAPGEIVTSGSTGVFSFEIHTTASNAASGLLAEMVSTTLNLTSLDAGFFTISVTEDNFTNPTPNADGEGQFHSIINASTVSGGSSFDASALVDGAVLNSVVGETTTATTENTDNMAIGSPFSITHEWTVYASGAEESVSFDMSTRAVPLPGVLSLLGLGLAGLAFALRRRREV